jgi:2-polyprenyl-3-methyl-5-hydroxy-6-metoxy-1,4-benzoquinol methylase
MYLELWGDYMSSSGKNNIPKKSVDEIIAYWDRRIRKSKDSLESVLWEDLPIWNRYVDEIQRYYLKRVFSMIKPSDVVLDVGCGIGRFTFRLSKICKEVVGIDSSSEAIKICKKKAEDYSSQRRYIKSMPIFNLSS